MVWIWVLVIGGIAGWLAGLIMRGHGFGVLGDVLVGVVGGAIGRVVFGLLELGSYGLLGSLVMATIGAVILIFVVRLVKRA